MKIKLRKRCIKVFVLTLCLLNVGAAEYFAGGAFNRLNDLLRALSASVILFVYCINLVRRKTQISDILILVLIMRGWTLLATLFHGGNLVLWFGRTASIIALELLIENTIDYFPDYIDGLMLLMEVVSYLNLILLIAFPEGLAGKRSYWLFGQKNLAAPYLLVACATAYLFRLNGGSKIREWGIYLVSFISSYLAESSASTFGFFILPLLYISIKEFHVRYNVNILLGINAVLYLLIIILQSDLEVFQFIVVDVLKKNMTFTGRTRIWADVLYYISRNPWMGYGDWYGDISKSPHAGQFGTFGTIWNFYAHNQILQVLFDGGIVSLIVFLLMMVMLCKRLQSVGENEAAQCLMVTLFVLNTMTLVESYWNGIIYILYYYAYFVSDPRWHLRGRAKRTSYVMPKKYLSNREMGK